MPEVMIKARQATPKSFLVGSFIKKEEVVILFSGTGNGKSILGIQFADDISKGNSCFQGVLPNECGPQKVMYFDWELTLNDYKERYTDAGGTEYAFASENYFRRVGNDDDNSKTFAEIARNMERILVQQIEQHRPNVVFIDNITAMSNGSTADAAVATKIMELLMKLKKNYKLTVIVLAHTPKRYDWSKPLGMEDLAGSAIISAYADSIIAIGSSKMGNDIKYLKHIKIRTGVKVHDENNVIQVAIVKEGAFLQMKTLEEPFGREMDHLIAKNEVTTNDAMLQKMIELNEEGKSFQEIKEELNINISRQHIMRLIKSHKEKKETVEFNSEKAEDAPF
jgi:SpoVK/Ycf46/Vps4 family AAA+-type ATPase